MTENEQKNLSSNQRELDLRSSDIEAQLQSAIKQNGILLICSDGALGGRSSVISTMLRKLDLPAFYLAKGIRGLAKLDTEMQSKILNLIPEFKFVMLYPTLAEVDSFSAPEKATISELQSALHFHNHAHFLSPQNTQLPNLLQIQEEYQSIV